MSSGRPYAAMVRRAALATLLSGFLLGVWACAQSPPTSNAVPVTGEPAPAAGEAPALLSPAATEILLATRSVASFDPNGWYRISPYWPGENYSLDVIGQGNHTNWLKLGDTGNYSGQAWQITPIGDGYHRLTTEYGGPGLSADILNDGAGNQPFLSATGEYSGQQWWIAPLGEGYYRLTTAWQGPGRSLDVVNDGMNRKVTLADTGDFTGQYWRITPWEAGPGFCEWRTSDIIDPRISIGAQTSLMRKMADGPPTSLSASAMIGAIKRGHLAGILLPPTQAVSDRGARMQPPRGHWDLIPAGQNSICLQEPAGESPMIVYRTELEPWAIDAALDDAWAQCGLQTPNPPCDYVVDRHRPPPGTPDLPALDAALVVQVLIGGAGADGAEVAIHVEGTDFQATQTTSGGGFAFFDPPPGVGIVAVLPPTAAHKMATRNRQIDPGMTNVLTIELEPQDQPTPQPTPGPVCDEDRWHESFNACGEQVIYGAGGCILQAWEDFAKCRTSPKSCLLGKFWDCRRELEHKKKIQQCVDKANAESGCSFAGAPAG